MTDYHLAHRLIGFHGKAHIALYKLLKPHKILYIEGLVQPECYLLCLYRRF